MTFEEVTRRNYKNLKWLLLMVCFFLGPLFAVMTSVPLWQPELPRFTIIFFWLYLLVYAAYLAPLIFLFKEGWFGWFSIFLGSAIASMGICAASGFFILLGVSLVRDIFFVFGSWFVLSLLMWWWGSRIYLSKDEIKEAVLRSKRIDLEQATYSPYRIPHDLYKAKWAKASLILGVTSVGAVAGLAAFLSYFISTRGGDSEGFWGAFWAYLLVPLSIFCLSAGYHEWRWMRRWEKKTGQKIYVKEIIEYKRLQERKQAEQAKLRSQRN